MKLQREVDALEKVIKEHGIDSAPEDTVSANQLRLDMQLDPCRQQLSWHYCHRAQLQSR